MTLQNTHWHMNQKAD
jgi:hypothetical protein